MCTPDGAPGNILPPCNISFYNVRMHTVSNPTWLSGICSRSTEREAATTGGASLMHILPTQLLLIYQSVFYEFLIHKGNRKGRSAPKINARSTFPISMASFPRHKERLSPFVKKALSDSSRSNGGAFGGGQ